MQCVDAALVFGARVISEKTAESIEMPFGQADSSELKESCIRLDGTPDLLREGKLFTAAVVTCLRMSVITYCSPAQQ